MRLKKIYSDLILVSLVVYHLIIYAIYYIFRKQAMLCYCADWLRFLNSYVRFIFSGNNFSLRTSDAKTIIT